MQTATQIVQLMSNKVFLLGLAVGLVLLLAFYVFNAWVGQMDVPADRSSKEYHRWHFYNLLALQLKRAAKAGHIPTADTICITQDEVEEIKNREASAGK